MIEIYALGVVTLFRLVANKPIIETAYFNLDWGGIAVLAILFIGFDLLLVRSVRRDVRRQRAAADAHDHS